MNELRFRKRNNRWESSFEAARADNKRKSISKEGFRTKTEASAAGAKAMNEYNKFNAGYSRNTLAVLKGVLTGSLSYAVLPLKYIQTNPAQYVELPSTRATPATKARSSPHVCLSPGQMDLILKRFPEGTSSYLPILIGHKCGLRISEAFGLTWDCIDLAAKTLTVRQQVIWHDRDRKTGTSGYWYFSAPKYDSVRTIELSQDVTDALERERARQNEARSACGDSYIQYFKDEQGHLNTGGDGKKGDFVLVRADGSCISSHTMQHVSWVATHELGFAEFDYHSLRHTHATMLAEKGASPQYVQHCLGHKNSQVTTQIYQRLIDKMAEEGTQLLELFGSAR